MTQPQLDEARIAEAAFFLWLEEGQPQGRDFDHWLRAQEALSDPAAKPKRKAAPKKAAAPKTAKPAAAKAKAAKPKTAATKTAKAKA